MGNYQYIARTASGEQVEGLMQGDNEMAIIRTLDERQLFPVRVTLQQTTRKSRGGRVRMRDVGTVYGQLADLIQSGVPLLRSLETVVKATNNPRMARTVGDVHSAVAEGKTFSEALARHPEVFGPLHTAMIHAGERGGFLEDVLVNLSGYIDRVDELRSKVMGAMIYPLVLTVFGGFALFGVLVWLVPKFRPIFNSMPSLPAPTKLLFGLSSFLLDDWPVMLCLIVLVVLGVMAALRSKAGKRLWDRWQLKLPGVGGLIRTICLTRFCRIFGTMLANGVPILQALAISKDAAGSAVLAQNIEEAAASVKAGEKLATPLAAGGLFPPEIVTMIAVAEESNQLEKVLVQIADKIERRANRQVDSVVRLIEPLILAIIAGVIGFVAMGLLTPIFTMSRTLK